MAKIPRSAEHKLIRIPPTKRNQKKRSSSWSTIGRSRTTNGSELAAPRRGTTRPVTRLCNDGRGCPLFIAAERGLLSSSCQGFVAGKGPHRGGERETGLRSLSSLPGGMTSILTRRMSSHGLSRIRRIFSADHASGRLRGVNEFFPMNRVDSAHEAMIDKVYDSLFSR